MTGLQAMFRSAGQTAAGRGMRVIYQKIARRLRGNSRRRYMNG